MHFVRVKHGREFIKQTGSATPLARLVSCIRWRTHGRTTACMAFKTRKRVKLKNQFIHRSMILD